MTCVSPSWPSSHWLKEIRPAFFSRAVLDNRSTSLLYYREAWVKVIFLKWCCIDLMQSIQAKRAIEWRFPMWFSQSMITLESPISWRCSMFWIVAKCSDAQAPNSSALVLVSGPQQKVHPMKEFVLILIRPSAPHKFPLRWAGPSNQL